MDSNEETVGLEERIERLFGIVSWSAADGIVHIAAIGNQPPRAIAIGPAAPASAIDRFVLGFSRARADVILTTGSILRAEPGLVHRYSSASAEESGFARWRAGVLGRSSAPQLCVLSESGHFPPDHVALRTGTSGVVWTTAAGADRIGGRLGDAWSVEAAIGSNDSLVASVEAAIDHVRRQLSARTISIEAGPTISNLLYPAAAGESNSSVCSPGHWVDELLLSRFGGALDPEAIGPAFVTPSRIASRFGAARTALHAREPSGLWHFERYAADA